VLRAPRPSPRALRVGVRNGPISKRRGVEPTSKDAAAKAAAFASGLRKSVTVSGRRWAQWPGGARDLDTVLACIDGVGRRLHVLLNSEDGVTAVPACVADLRAILEWTTYQSASIATARALLFARKTRAFVNRLGLLGPASTQSILDSDSETSLMENVRTKNDYMKSLAERHPHLGLPVPLVRPEGLAPKPEKKPGKLDLIQQLTKKTKK
jgi:hypothetical protein